MAGHSHWAGIKHKKGLADKKRGKLFGKLSRAIIVAAQAGGTELLIPDDATCRAAAEMVDRFLAGNDGKGVGELEFDAWVRLVEGL